jgi:exopolysaccharide biosynthesis glucuronosyltransferase PssD
MLNVKLKSKGPRILAVASGGGHWLEMRRLYPAFEGLDVAFVSVHPNYGLQVRGHRFYTVRDVTRWDRWKMVVLIAQLLRILLLELPNIVITTGSAPGLIALALGKVLFGARTMWIDSIANCERLSSSGVHAGRVANVWLTQWPQLKAAKGPTYWGSVL